ncbi:imidazolonepropionase [Salibacteraceae bacterium]|mgnify:FL=1|jgi:imidazolonepropionase|nr:imidazolonepropionase [Salibacteraceae bacterium]MDB9710029.1 imidazolonepropionase [Salibacteraceae bacterium]MDC1304246.1 imidazolonepropionase [Salibacteraceae bacterium]
MKVFINIKSLLQTRSEECLVVKGKDMKNLPSIENAWMSVRNGRIEDMGPMSDFNKDHFNDYEVSDVSGKYILPTWVDSHTHLVFADWRNQEFEDRINGMTYQEIANRGGGILNSAKKLNELSEDDLYDAALLRLNDVIYQGTGAIEIKSGYGLNLKAELKMLRVIKRLKEVSPIPIKSTFLGAHAFPEGYAHRKDDYVNEIIEKMIPKMAEDNLAEYIDVFCEEGYFNVEQTDRILKAGANYGLKPKVHVNQFNIIGGIETSVKNNAISVDHLELINEADITCLKSSSTIAVALPSCSFFLEIPYTPAKDLMDNDIPVALATDFNPGSTPSGNMNFVFSLACIKMKMTPEQALNAMTINGAAAIELAHECGSITKGKLANFILTDKIKSLSFLPYAFGNNHIDSVYINGEKFSA